MRAASLPGSIHLLFITYNNLPEIHYWGRLRRMDKCQRMWNFWIKKRQLHDVWVFHWGKTSFLSDLISFVTFYRDDNISSSSSYKSTRIHQEENQKDFHLTPYLEVHLECRWWHFKHCKGQMFWFVTVNSQLKSS